MKKKWQVLLLIGAAGLAGGCSSIGYFVQAAHGQFSLLSEARPIEDWLASPDTEAKLKGKLERVREIRAFAARELDLPDNDTFTTYADLKRPFVMWNVVAAPELSLKPMQWCFPVAGCVKYRGYYSRRDAEAYAEQLRAQNYDVDISGVPAYSTLGWFSDPVLSSFIGYPDGQLARLVFHELAHQVVYVPGDSTFNESFAVAVEEVGVERWLMKHGDDKTREAYAAYESRKRDFLALLMKQRDALKALYASDLDDDHKRREKAAIFKALKEEYQVLKKERWNGHTGYDRWFAEPLSNAHLSAVATYHDLVPGFRALLARQKDLGRFYESVRAMSGLDKDERHRQLAALAQPPTVASGRQSADSR